MLWADNKMPRRIRQRSEQREDSSSSRGQHSSTLSTTTVFGTVQPVAPAVQLVTSKSSDVVSEGT